MVKYLFSLLDSFFLELLFSVKAKFKYPRMDIGSVVFLIFFTI